MHLPCLIQKLTHYPDAFDLAFRGRITTEQVKLKGLGQGLP